MYISLGFLPPYPLCVDIYIHRQNPPNTDECDHELELWGIGARRGEHKHSGQGRVFATRAVTWPRRPVERLLGLALCSWCQRASPPRKRVHVSQDQQCARTHVNAVRRAHTPFVLFVVCTIAVVQWLLVSGAPAVRDCWLSPDNLNCAARSWARVWRRPSRWRWQLWGCLRSH